MDALLVGVPTPSVILWGADAAAVAILCTVAAAIPARRVVHVHPSAVLRTL
jgi:ABC-type lipoprotein release transport system permease subunit